MYIVFGQCVYNSDARSGRSPTDLPAETSAQAGASDFLRDIEVVGGKRIF